MRVGMLISAVMLLAAGAAQAQGFAADDLDVGEPVLTHNLAVVPLFTRKAAPYDEYVVLEEAQKQKSVRISETQGGQVDRLVVRNNDTDQRPLYLLGGEVVLGGKQDRMVVSDTVVEPKATQRVEVRCVEQGRWAGADLTFHSSEAVAHPDLRKAAMFKGQGDVWNEVARKSAASNVSSTTGTYRRVLQDESVRRRIKGYLDELQAKIPRSEKLIGLAVAINGELELVDVFDSPKLYAKLERKLLTSYVLAALERQPGSVAKAKAYEQKAKALGKANVDKLLKPSAGNTEATAQAQDGSSSVPSFRGTRVQAKSGPNSKVFMHKGKAVHGTYFGEEKQKTSE
ncbi:MAG: hypothetical protein HY901_00625 [Deltaproteobacteria bacterium]|nr:hypothetical protein [Deltaproteobacteria bacterium]